MRSPTMICWTIAGGRVKRIDLLRPMGKRKRVKEKKISSTWKGGPVSIYGPPARYKNGLGRRHRGFGKCTGVAPAKILVKNGVVLDPSFIIQNGQLQKRSD